MEPNQPPSPHDAGPEASANERRVPNQVSDPALLDTILDEATARYFTDRRARLAEFAAEIFSFRGAAGLNAHALGHDLWRAPLNVAAAGPNLVVQGAAAGLRAAGARSAAAVLDRTDLHIRTDVERELEWRVYRDWLELPLEQPERDRVTTKDALGDLIFADPRLDAIWHPVLNRLARRADDPDLRRALDSALATYHTTRTAAGELTNLGLSLATGALLVHQTTPGLVSLAPSIAQATAEKLAVAHFPFGPAAGKLWYSVMPAPPAFIAGSAAAAGLLSAFAAVTALSGFALDPLQHKLGLHERRLTRLLDTLEVNFSGNTQARYIVRDHYVSRLLDAIDLVAAVWAHAR